MSIIQIVLGLQVFTLIYYVVTTLVDLAPFNSVRHVPERQRKLEAVMNTPMFALPLVGAALYASQVWPGKGGLWVAFLFYLGLCIGAVFSWWVPYFYKPYSKNFADHFEHFKHSWTILPAKPGNPVVPNVEHLILHALMAACLGATAMVLFG